jgi:tetratricopeptide (TPR) repeat protein
VEFLFELARNDAEQREKAWAKSRAALELLNAWNDDRWFERQGFKSFASEQLGSIREEVAQLFGLLVRDRLTQASRLDPGSERDRLLQEAETWNERLIHTHPSGIELRRVWVDRLELAHMRNQSDDLAMIQSRLEELPRATSDLMEEGRQLLQKGKSREALTLLVDLLNANPQHYWASFYAGLAEHQLGKYPEAISHFDRCESLVPGFYGVWFNRATTAFAARNYAAAEADYSRVLESRPEWAEVYFNRARSREGLKRYREALDDLDLAMEHGYSPTLIYLMRSRLHASRTTRLLRIATSPQLWKRHRPMNGAGWLGRCYSRKATLRLP